MDRTVDILSKVAEFSRFVFHIVTVRFRYRRYDGTMSPETERLVFERGESVAALVHNLDSDEFYFTEQFRIATHEKGPGWLLELPAGIIDRDETPEEALARELEEEIGYRPVSMSHIATVYLSPGACSESIHIYYATVNQSTHVSTGGGLDSEGEDIKKVCFSPSEAKQMVAEHKIVDAKTLIAVQWYLNQADRQ